jgi:hypothetical protein
MRHAPSTGLREKPVPRAPERDQLVVAAVAAAQSREAVGQDAAFGEAIELILEKLRQVGASGLGLGEGGCGVLPHQAVQRGLFRAAALVEDRRASRRPLRLPSDGLHGQLPTR